MYIRERLQVQGDVLVLEIRILIQVKVGQNSLKLLPAYMIVQLHIGPAGIPDPGLGHLSALHGPESRHGTQDVNFKMRLGRQILHNAGYFHGNLFLKEQGFPHGGFIPKVALGGAFRKHYPVGFVQDCERISFQKRKVEHLEYR